MCGGRFGIDRQRIAGAALSGRRIAEREQGDGEIDVRIPVRRIDFDRLAKAGHRARRLRQRLHRAAQLVVDFRDARIGFERAAQQLGRLEVPAGPVFDSALRMQRKRALADGGSAGT